MSAVSARRRALLWLAGGVLVFAAAACAAVVLIRRPTHDRAWALDHSRLPAITITDSVVRIDDVRTFRQQPGAPARAAWASRVYHLDRLVRVWFVLTPFSAAWRGPAHSFVSFEFSDSSFVAISVEARREEGEPYGLLRGLVNSLELIYVIGDEPDLIGRRVLAAEHDVYLYPITTTPARARALFVDMLERAEALRRHPEFYHTLSNNCTTNLVRHVNRVAPGRIPSGLALLFPGYADEVALSLGLVDGRDAGIDAVREQYRINDRARTFLADSAFSFRIRS